MISIVKISAFRHLNSFYIVLKRATFPRLESFIIAFGLQSCPISLGCIFFKAPQASSNNLLAAFVTLSSKTSILITLLYLSNFLLGLVSFLSLRRLSYWRSSLFVKDCIVVLAASFITNLLSFLICKAIARARFAPISTRSTSSSTCFPFRSIRIA